VPLPLLAAGDLRFDAALGASAEQQLRQQITPATAPAIMALAVQHRNQQLQARCVEVMTAARKNDVWGVLAFACRFSCRVLQGSCLGFLRFSSRGILLDRAERIVQVCGWSSFCRWQQSCCSCKQATVPHASGLVALPLCRTGCQPSPAAGAGAV
jgi:hypothetical protein